MKTVLSDQKGLWLIEYFRPEDGLKTFSAICEYEYTGVQEEFEDLADQVHHYKIIYVNYPTKDSPKNEKIYGWYYIRKLKGDINDNPEYFI